MGRHGSKAVGGGNVNIIETDSGQGRAAPRARRVARRTLLVLGVCLLGTGGAAQAATITVNTTADPSGSGCGVTAGPPPPCSLRQAVAAAAASDTISVPSSSTPYVLTQGTPIPVSKTVTIQGGGAATTIINAAGNIAGGLQSRAFVVSGRGVVIEGLSIVNSADGNDEVPCNACGTLTLNGGGAIWDEGISLTLANDAFSGDSAPVGGAVSVSNNSSLTITGTSFTNDGAAFGGGLFVRSGTVGVGASTFETDGSGAYGGGAVFLYGGTTTLTNTTIVDSGWASSRGGGIENDAGTLTLQYDTLSGNLRGGLQTDQGASTSVGSTILASGFSDSTDFDCVAAGQVTGADGATTAAAITHDLGRNIDQDGACGLPAAGDYSGVDPLLASIADNGGPVATQALLHGSPAFNGGNASSCPAADARGTTRPAGAVCDIGAFQATALSGLPAATTTAATRVTSSDAALGANVNLAGEAGGLHFNWGTAPGALTNTTFELGVGVLSSSTAETQDLAGLNPGTTYYIQAVADNASGSATAGNTLSFTTAAAAPTATNPSVTGVTDTTVQLAFTVNPNGADTKYVIEYGPGTLSSSTPAVDIGATAGDQNLTATLTGLTPGTAYEYDLVATNSAGSYDTGTFPVSTDQQFSGTVGDVAQLVDNEDLPSCPTASVDWGDGSATQNVTPSCQPDSGDGQLVSLTAPHTYATAGRFPVQISYDGILVTQYAVIAAATTATTTTSTTAASSSSTTTESTSSGPAPSGGGGQSATSTSATAATSTATQSVQATSSTVAATLPPPVLFRSANVTPVSGVVYIKLPPGATLSRYGPPRASASASKGVGFIPLTQARQIPVGSVLDTRAGTVAVTAASTTKGQPSTGDFTAGVFTLLQSRTQRGLVQLNLQDSRSRSVCATTGKGARATAAKKVSNAVLGLLKSTDHGKFSTRGSYSAATVRGTQYSVADTCAGTLTTVVRGSVAVDYFRRHKTVIVKAGHAFLAKASGAPSSVLTVGK